MHQHPTRVLLQLCSGSEPEMREKLGLLPAPEFHFLAQSKMFTCDGVVESDAWAEMIASMEAVGLNKSARLAVFKLVACVLFLGNMCVAGAACNTDV
jgi:myosin heavy subunit